MFVDMPWPVSFTVTGLTGHAVDNSTGQPTTQPEAVSRRCHQHEVWQNNVIVCVTLTSCRVGVLSLNGQHSLHPLSAACAQCWQSRDGGGDSRQVLCKSFHTCSKPPTRHRIDLLRAGQVITVRLPDLPVLGAFYVLFMFFVSGSLAFSMPKTRTHSILFFAPFYRRRRFFCQNDLIFQKSTLVKS